ncbi:cytosine-specific methyltransferase [Paenibacillus sp. J45TS6]|uniref:DNA cytosine methyltransferase n=1 Tax=Paenibacillus sp. J45TS6 TaxID=2807196 RepID=UPI001B19ED45|nr:DNA cytosine methyltransferase [Paenibacillus sp. J45TS6]GIP45060.1 cytosine-specific methyltransferase [Paenibacillus sp. J45TS6]
MIFKKGELFNGPGGFAWAAKHAKVEANGEVYSIEHAWSNDYDVSACETYKHNICPDKPDTVYHGDVRELDINSLSDIDAFIYGFPCNDFSVVGEKKGFDGEFGPLYTYGIKVLKRFQPKWFIAENVGGLQSANEGRAFARILRDMVDAGYKVTPHLYNFANYGVPQSRQRILIVGFRNDLNVQFRVPAPTHGPGLPFPFKTAYEAITDPPIPEGALNHDMPKHTKKVIEFLESIPPGQNAWYEGIPEHLRLNVKGARMSQIYRRLDTVSPSYTVTGSGGGGTHMYHWEEPRALTNRERARLQTFPDSFEFKGPKDKVRQQVGMAVPPNGAKVIIEAVLKTYAGVPYDHIAPKWDIDELLNQTTILV